MQYVIKSLHILASGGQREVKKTRKLALTETTQNKEYSSIYEGFCLVLLDHLLYQRHSQKRRPYTMGVPLHTQFLFTDLTLVCLGKERGDLLCFETLSMKQFSVILWLLQNS
jgi:hypothetical protein